MNPQIPIPEGWQLVPQKPTPEMMAAARAAVSFWYIQEKRYGRTFPSGYHLGDKEKYTLRWKAMLAAAPEFNQTSTSKEIAI
jgi:hypothetical protein